MYSPVHRDPLFVTFLLFCCLFFFLVYTRKKTRNHRKNRKKFIPRNYRDQIIEMMKKKNFILHELKGGIANLSGESGKKMEEKKHVTSLLICRNERGQARRVDIVVVPPEHWSYALLGWSGSTEMEKSWKHYTKHEYAGRPNVVDENGRKRKIEGQLRWYLSNSRLCYCIKPKGDQVLDKDVQYEPDCCTTERDILRELGLPWLEPWQRCA